MIHCKLWFERRQMLSTKKPKTKKRQRNTTPNEIQKNALNSKFCCVVSINSRNFIAQFLSITYWCSHFQNEYFESLFSVFLISIEWFLAFLKWKFSVLIPVKNINTSNGTDFDDPLVSNRNNNTKWVIRWTSIYQGVPLTASKID